MKKTVLVLLALIFVVGLQNNFAQEKKMSRAEKKAAEKKQEEAEWLLLKKKLEDKSFIFKANILNTTRGTVTLDPRINFLIVNDKEGTLQMASGYGGGQNGIGGYTVNAIVDNYKVTTGKPGKVINVNLILMPHGGQGVVSQPLNISITAFSFESVRLTIGSGRKFLQGEIVNTENSGVFKGNTPN